MLALDTMTTPFSVEITLSIEETARAHGWNSFVVNMFSNDKPEKMVDLLLAHRPDGIIYTAMGLRRYRYRKSCISIAACWQTVKAQAALFPPIFPMMNKGNILA